MKKVAIFGATGYAGIELTQILGAHPKVVVTHLASDRLAGRSVAAQTGANVAGTYVPTEEVLSAAPQLEAAFLCTPADVSMALAAQLRAHPLCTIDLSGAHRLDDQGAWTEHYGQKASSANHAVGRYGLRELFRDETAREATSDATPRTGGQLIANPGCYATAVALALAPAVEAGVVYEDALMVSAMSGVTGAGRTAREDLSFGELSDDARAYKVLRHQHTPEIEMALRRLTKADVRVTFTPHLVPIRRGILVTAHLRLRKPMDPAALRTLYRQRYEGEPFVTVVDAPEEVTLRKVVGTNHSVVGVAADGHAAVVVLALDNLVKGAAGQAVQNMNHYFGFPETEGLLGLRRFAP
jgi:N-acetyl-gamma-glutamyl-phosphate reductase